MTALATGSRPVAGAADDEVTVRLRSLLDTEFLTQLGWNEERMIWRPPRGDPLVGYQVCVIMGCQTVIGHRKQLCAFCSRAWRASDQTLAEFAAQHRRERKEWGEIICAVPGCERPAKSAPRKLCPAHLWHHLRSGTSLEEFLIRPDLTPYPHPGFCLVRLCDWRRYSNAGLCLPHTKLSQKLRRQDPNVDLQHWMRTAPARRDGRQVDLQGLPPLVVAEILFGLQHRYRPGTSPSCTGCAHFATKPAPSRSAPCGIWSAATRTSSHCDPRS